MVQPSPLVLEHFHHPQKKSHVHCLLPPAPATLQFFLLSLVLLNVLIKLQTLWLMTSTSNIWLTCSRASHHACVTHPKSFLPNLQCLSYLDPGFFLLYNLLFERDLDPFKKKAYTHRRKNKTQSLSFQDEFLRWLHFKGPYQKIFFQQCILV